MNNVLRNFWMDLALFLLLGLSITTLGGVRADAPRADLGLAGYLHVFSGIVLTLGCLVHIGLHWQWFRAVLTGKTKGRIKLVMNSLVAILLLLAGLSGRAALSSTAAAGFHSLTGSIALLGLFIHAVKHVSWMVSTTKRLTIGPRLEKAGPTAQTQFQQEVKP
jgi:hypothetical protein